MWKTVLFDLDGTVTDSGEGITKCVQYALDQGFGIHCEDLTELRSFVGPPLKEQFMEYASLTSEEGDRAVELYRERYNTKGIYENALYPGIPELLSAIKMEGMKIALSSSKPEVYCRRILEHFHIAHYFDVIVGSELDGTRVDKAEVIEEVLRRLGPDIKREETVLIGDRSYDVAGAKQCGIASVGVTYGYGSRTELEQKWPECIVDTVTELKNVLIGQYREGIQDTDPQAAYYGQYNSRVKRNRPGSLPLYPSDGPAFMRVFRVISPLLIDILVQYAAGIVLGVILVFYYNGDVTTAQQSLINNPLALTGIVDLCVIVIMALMMRGDERQRRYMHAEERLMKRHSFRARDILMMLAAVSTVNVLGNMISTFLIPLSDIYESMLEEINRMPPVAMFLIVAIIGPVAEELLFRGMIYRRARDYFQVYTAALISGVLFGIFHMNLSQGVPAVLIGFMFCMIYEHYGTLKSTILAHIMINAVGSLSIITDNQIVNRVGDAAMMILAIIGIYCITYIFTRDEKVNRA